MPLIDPFSVVVVSKGGHRAAVSRGSFNESTTVKSFNDLRCIKCHQIRYAGKKVEICGHNVCQLCIDNRAANTHGPSACLDCSGDLTGKELQDYSIRGEQLVELWCQVVKNKKHEIQFKNVDEYCASHCQPSQMRSETGVGVDLRCYEPFNPDDLEDLSDVSDTLQRWEEVTAEDLFIFTPFNPDSHEQI